MNDKSLVHLQWPFIFSGGLLGLLLSWGLLSGDAQGKVNLLYLVFLFVLVPLISLGLTLFSLFGRKGLNLASLLTHLPIWPASLKQGFSYCQQQDKHWLLLQSQGAALAFSVATLVSFFLLLLVTDLHFVWRSTLLSPQDVQGFLGLIACPWFFWLGAQPSIELLQQTQDVRLTPKVGELSAYAAWWQFVLATQLFYCVIPRSLLVLGLRWRGVRLGQKSLQAELSQKWQQYHHPDGNEHFELQPVEELPISISKLINWGNVPAYCLNSILTSEQLNKVHSREQATTTAKGAVFIVKAWEPPLGELEDCLTHGQGYLLPLDWQNNQLVPLQLAHLQEWQRFAKKLNWRLCLPAAYRPPVSSEAGQ